MKRLFTIYITLLIAMLAQAKTQEYVPRMQYPGKKSYTYRIVLSDKRGCGYSIDKPRQFLSQKAIDRRNRQRLAIDSTDLPVNNAYIKRIMELSDEMLVVGKSKWNNTVLINTTDTTITKNILKMNFVRTALSSM